MTVDGDQTSGQRSRPTTDGPRARPDQRPGARDAAGGGDDRRIHQMAADQQAEGPEAAARHVPVMLERCLDLLAPALEIPEPLVVDATLGMGGHTFHLLERFPELRVIGIDRDPQAHHLAAERLRGFGERFIPFHGTYDQISEALETAGRDTADGVLFDLGVSSFQLDERERGFAYSYDAPLDMRMNPEDELTAAHIVNTYEENHIRVILRDWGEERFAGRIAKALVEVRREAPILRTGQLVEVVERAVPAAAKRRGGHPAKRTFQALRIEVNHELEVLRRAMPAALASIRVGGRVVAMSYHSLEDRIVKRSITELSTSKAPKGFPVELEEHQPEVRVLTRGAEPPTEDEISANSRAASAKLRAAERIRDPRTRA